MLDNFTKYAGHEIYTLFFYARISRKASKRANGTQNKPVSMRCNYSDILSFAVTGGFSQSSKRIFQKGPVVIYPKYVDMQIHE